jgi:hypothetical protein
MHLLSDLPELIYQKGHIEIEYLPRYRTLTISWSGQIIEDDYKTALSELLKFILLYEIEHLLIDARDSDTQERSDKEWVNSFFREKLSKTGIRKIARIGCGFLMKEAVVSKRINEFHKTQQLPFIFRYVQDMNAALEWFSTIE